MNHNTKAILLVVLSMAVFTVLDASAKFVMDSVALPVALFFRYAVAGLLVLAYGLLAEGPRLFETQQIPLQIIRAFCLLGSTYFNFMAMSHLQLAQTSALMFTIPIWVCVLSVPLLGEQVGLRRWFGVLLGFVGVLLIMRPGTASFHWAMLFSLAASLAGALYNITTRKIGGRDMAITSLFYASAGGAVLAVPLAGWFWHLPQGSLQWLLLVLMGVVGAGGHFLLIRAHQMADASTLAPFIYTQIIWMIAAGYLVFGNLPDAYTLLGAIIVVASSIYIFARERARGHTEALAAPAD